jgi:hypothetical protein
VTDPKLNKSTDAQDDVTDRPASPVSEEENSERLRRPRAGLSINDTIARNANLSVGSRGVDTSGVRSGSGAGAGTSHLTPGERGGSPAPNIVPDAQGTGMTPRSDNAPGQNPTINLGAEGPTHDEIAARAHRCWHERGCPEGSPEVDWQRAEQELRAERQSRRSQTAST